MICWLLLVVLGSGFLLLLRSNRALRRRMLDTETVRQAAVHDQQEQRRHTDALESFFTVSIEPLCVIGFDGAFRRFNPAWEKAVGYSAKELAHVALADLIHPGDRAAFDTAYQQMLGGTEMRDFECRWIARDGGVRWLLWNAVALPPAQVVYAAARDVTGRQLTEHDRERKAEALACLNEELRRDVSRHRAAEERIRSDVRDLARSNSELERFAYVCSHDLQEPLRTIGGFVQLLERRYRDRLDDTAERWISYSVDGVKRMQQLISDLLAYSRVTRGNHQAAPVDTTIMISCVLRNLRAAIAESGAEVTYDPLPGITGNAPQIVQLFQNLIGNAIKFRSEAPPRVHLSAQPHPDGWLFSVKDNGIGIDPKDGARIFDIFQRLHERTEYPGTGIGLAICQKIVEAHGGRIWVESQPGSGAVFYFTIPEKGHANDGTTNREARGDSPGGG
jgi:PAS domain S-box-containing protein